MMSMYGFLRSHKTQMQHVTDDSRQIEDFKYELNATIA